MRGVWPACAPLTEHPDWLRKVPVAVQVHHACLGSRRLCRLPVNLPEGAGVPLPAAVRLPLEPQSAISPLEPQSAIKPSNRNQDIGHPQTADRDSRGFGALAGGEAEHGSGRKQTLRLPVRPQPDPC